MRHTIPPAALAMCAAVFACAAGAAPVGASSLHSGSFLITADGIAVDRNSGSFVATGGVEAASAPSRLFSERVERGQDGVLRLSDPSTVTTCSNDVHELHWLLVGEAQFASGRYVLLRNAWLRMWDVPVLWLPYWYYPLDTDYGLRMMPGYTSRWGAYLLTKYVYGIASGGPEGSWRLRGSTRLDLRTKNGIAAGQGLHWDVGEYGKGDFKVYYAWDEDYDRYDRSWSTSRRRNYQNWGSDVSYDRWAVSAQHRWDVTERDTLRAAGTVFSDSHFNSDFLRDSLFSYKNRFYGIGENEVAWERNESCYGAGLSASGPLNRFYGGTARLPEFYLDVVPQPVFSLPVNYESQTHVGYLDRQAARYGNSATSRFYSYSPGAWADFNTFRLDTYHRFTAPFKAFDDVLSVVPRVAYRGTMWGEGGYDGLNGLARAGESGDTVYRSIFEGGVTFAARGVAWIDERWQHVLSPYVDVLAQEADYSGLGRGERPYVFDSLDASREWSDQFAGRSRNLPYSWYGFTPGVRNAFRRADEKGRLSTVFDIDAYTALQLNEAEWIGGNRFHRLAKPGEPNYGKHQPAAVPGMRMRWFPDEGSSISARAEYDADDNRISYASLSWMQRLTKTLGGSVSFVHRDHRIWDFSSAPYSPALMEREDFNWARFSFVKVELEHELCDQVAWSPFISWDCREDELDETGFWIDYRTDCLGFRFIVGYENSYTRIDGAEYDDDWRFGFFVYLRALGPGFGNPLSGN